MLVYKLEVVNSWRDHRTRIYLSKKLFFLIYCKGAYFIACYLQQKKFILYSIIVLFAYARLWATPSNH